MTDNKAPIKKGYETIKENGLDILKDIFENTNRWLQFGEAKNGALIGINGLFLFNSIDYLFDILNGKLNVNIFIVGIMITIFGFSTIGSLISFMPNMSKMINNMELTSEHNCKDDGVLIFFEDICKYESPEIYLKDIYKNYLSFNIEIENLEKLELDYAKEIIINSKIASYKYKLFKIGVKLNLVAIVIFFAFLIIA